MKSKSLMVSQHYRQVQLDRVLGLPNEMDILFYSIWNDLKVLNTDVHNQDGGEFIYYNSDIFPIFYQDSKNDEYWCDSDEYWEIFKSKFSMEYYEIQSFTWYMVTEALKKEVATPDQTSFYLKDIVTEALKKLGIWN